MMHYQTLSLAKLPRTALANTSLWFTLSLVFPLYAGGFFLWEVFHQPYVVQDDVRQHVAWFQQFVDPALFQDDLIADYFQAIAPVGMKALYWTLAKLGLDPLLAAKLLPPVLGLLATIYCFKLSLQLFTVPAGAFFSSLILSQSLWLGSDLVSATSRAFPVLLLLVFLHALVKRSLATCLIAIALQGLFYPVLLLVEGGVLTVRLLQWKNNHLKPSPDWVNYVFWLAGYAVALGVLLLVKPDLAELGPTVTATQMVTMPEFGANGRAGFFDQNFWQLWLISNRGISPPFYPPVIWLSLLLPLLISRQLPLTHRITKEAKVLLELLFPSFIWFILAHVLLLRLYFPSRYTQHSLRVAMALAAGIAVTILLETGRRWLQHRSQHRLTAGQRLAIAAVGLFAAASLIVPALPSILGSGHVLITGEVPPLYQFFAQQPKDSLIASLAAEADNLPAFSQRSTLVGREYALPFHVGYYDQIRQRATDLIRAHYSSDIGEVQQFIQTYGVDFFLIQRGAFNPDYIANNDWLMQYQPAASEAIASLQQPNQPALAKLIRQCSVLDVDSFIVLKADCITGAQRR